MNRLTLSFSTRQLMVTLVPLAILVIIGAILMRSIGQFEGQLERANARGEFMAQVGRLNAELEQRLSLLYRGQLARSRGNTERAGEFVDRLTANETRTRQRFTNVVTGAETLDMALPDSLSLALDDFMDDTREAGRALTSFSSLDDIQQRYRTLEATLAEMSDQPGANDGAASFTEALTAEMLVAGLVVVLATIAAFLGYRSLRKTLGTEPERLRTIVHAIRDVRYDIDYPDVIEPGSILEAIRDMQVRIQEVTKNSIRDARIRKAMDVTSTNVMIADADRNIVYMNEAVTEMMQESESDLRKDLPQFRADEILGGSMDRFHKNPRHQMDMLGALQGLYETEITVGGRTFRLKANPIIDDETGDRLGTIVEWLDRTEEVWAESEVTRIVAGAAEGDFSRTMTLDGRRGFFLSVGKAINELVGTANEALTKVNQALSRLSNGDLTVRIEDDFQGSFGELKDYCNKTAHSLDTMLSEVSDTVMTIQTASAEIAQGNSDLSNRTEQQASNLEETASSMEELTSTVKSNSDNAQQANRLAEQATEVATQGGTLIRDVVATMEAINDSAQKISDIIGVIDGIAFQTNILALNAAVEAARAGEQGRGFAVVASEVRSLAQRSANAAKDIKALISDSVEKIQSGNTLVNQSGDTMDDIVKSIQRVNDIMGDIAAASSEQSTGIQEVTTAVSQMDEMTQQNAALVEETAASSENLQAQAESLARNVAVFTLSQRQQTVSAVEPASTAAHKQQARNTLRSVSAGRRQETLKTGTHGDRITVPDSGDDDEWESF